MLFRSIKTEMEGATDLNSLASKIGKTVEKASEVTFAAYSIPGVGGERKLIGSAFLMNKGQISTPIADNKGVYVIVVDEIGESGATVNLPLAKMQLARNNESRVDYEVFGAIQEAAEIEDNRSKFY